jgi:hypothetical protein
MGGIANFLKFTVLVFFTEQRCFVEYQLFRGLLVALELAFYPDWYGGNICMPFQLER